MKEKLESLEFGISGGVSKWEENVGLYSGWGRLSPCTMHTQLYPLYRILKSTDPNDIECEWSEDWFIGRNSDCKKEKRGIFFLANKKIYILLSFY